MAVKDPKELFVVLLSDVRQSVERTGKILQELSQAAELPDISSATTVHYGRRKKTTGRSRFIGK
jgi:hypothetical protein